MGLAVLFICKKTVNPFELTVGRRARRHSDAVFLFSNIVKKGSHSITEVAATDRFRPKMRGTVASFPNSKDTINLEK